MPVGVVTSTSISSAPAVVPAGPEARFFVAGVTERGPVDTAVRCRSLADFEATFGAAVSYSNLHEHMRVFWAEGGYEAYVLRLVGPTAVNATRSLDTGKLVVTARDPGAFANTWTCEYTTATKTLVIVTDTATETYVGSDLTTLLAAAAASATVTVTSSGTLPSADVASGALASGADDRANITPTLAVEALDAFGDGLGTGAVALPGWTADQVGTDLVEWARTTRRVALLASARTDSLSDAQGDIDVGDSEGSAGLFWPWLVSPSGAVISPESAVAGARSRAIRSAGPWVAPAGGNGILGYIADVDQTATRTEIDTAHDDYGVNVINVVSGGPRIYGWRSLAADTANLRYVHYRDVLNVIGVNVERALEPYVYSPVSAALAQNVAGTCLGVLEPLVTGGGLFPLLDDDGGQIDPGYKVEVAVSTGVNGEGILEPSIAVRIVPAAELIRVPITKVAVGATLA